MSTPPAPVDYSITQNIPVADHVYKYLLHRYGTDHIKATRNTTIGSLVLSLQGRNKDKRPAKKSGFTKIFKATITEQAYNKLGIHLSEENAQLFNDQVDKMLREELYWHVTINKGQTNKMHINSIRSFMEAYDITEDDIKLDTLYRDFKRRRENHLKKPHN